MNQYGYFPPIIRDGDFRHGDGLLGTVTLNPSGQWDSYLPDDELQNRGYETYSCVSEAILHCTEILERFKWKGVTKYAVRFLATVSGTGIKRGNDDGTVAETLRTGGCCIENDWGFDAVNYDAFYTQPPQSVRDLAKREFSNDSFGHSWITDTSPQAMMNALTFSPLALGVFAWPVPDAQGIYHRPQGAQDCHEITVYGYVLNQYWKIFDSYDSTHKKLAWDYGFGTGKRFTLDRATPPPHLFLKNLGYGMTDLEVTELQKALVSLKYQIPDAVTDQYLSETRSAVMAFQRDHGISDDGSHFGPRTRQALNQTLNPSAPFGGSLITYIQSLFSGV